MAKKALQLLILTAMASGMACFAQFDDSQAKIDERGHEWFADLIMDRLRTAVGRETPEVEWEYERNTKARIYLGQRLSQSTSSELGKTVGCVRGVRLTMIFEANEVGWVSAYLCDRTRDITPGELKDALATSREIFSALGESIDPASKKRLGIPQSEERLADGSMRSYFSVALFGHGAAFLPTLVFVPPDGKNLMVIQVETESLCRRKPDARMCMATKEVLGSVASGLMTRPP